MTPEYNNDIKITKAGTCLLLSVSKADDIIDNEELKIIEEIITEFFDINKNEGLQIINECLILIEEATDIYEFGKVLNENFSYQDKIDFICCTFEVAFVDNNMDYLEEHIIKKISTILNVEHIDLIKSRNEIKKYLT